MPDKGDPSRRDPHTTESTWDVTTPVSSLHSPASTTSLFSSHAFNPGDTIAGRFRIVAILGKGGMGEVYRADDLTLGSSVALKFLPPDFVADPVRLERFRAEVRLARQVSHPNICRVYDIVEAHHDNQSRHFIAMEYIDGEDLASLVRRIGRLPGDKAVEIARQLCAGLAAAHEQGIIHRDLKPANVMIDGRGRARITDFGIAAAADSIEGAHAVAGTPQYMAPEQLAGKEVTKRSDIYSLGLVLYELFSGRKAHDAKTIADLTRLHSSSSTSTSISAVVPDVNPAVERVIDRCLARDPKDRPPSAIAVAAALPGGDPVAAALAAGETPSPEMLAAVGHIEGVNPWIMLGCLAGAILLAIAVALVAPLVKLEPRVDMPRSTDVLVDNAQQIVRTLGVDAPPQSTAHGWLTNSNYFDWIKTNDQSPNRWKRISESNEPPPVLFWYRQHTAAMDPINAVHRVRPFDPPLDDHGMVLVVTDAEGRLHRFFAVTPRQADPEDHPAPSMEPDFGAAFSLAGLDLADFTATEFTHDPRFRLDTQHAWKGTFPDAPDVPIIVHTGIYDGNLASFDILEPWNIEDAAAAGTSDAIDIQAVPLVIVITTVILGGAILAWRNVRLGRIDRRGTVRVALFVFVCLTIGNLIEQRHLPFFLDIIFGENMLVSGSLRQAGFFALFYLAIEPYARRLWPSMLVTWARVTTGKFRDPLVGRDIVVGLLAGSTLSLLAALAAITNLWFDLPTGAPKLSPALGLRDALATLAWSVGGSIIGAAAWTLILVLLRMILRRKLLAAIGFVALGLVFGPEQDPGVGMVFAPLAQLVILLILLRFGLFALYIAFLTSALIDVVPTATDLSVWYASPTYLVIVFLAILAAYAFTTATAGRALFDDGRAATA